MTGWKYRYPDIPNLETMNPTPRLLLGQRLWWTEKKDGSNITIWLKDETVQISSRNLEEASKDLQTLTKGTEEYHKVLELLKENPEFIIYVEVCRKGESITKAEIYERPSLWLFDIYDREAEKFLPYVLVHQHGYHHKIPVVGLYAESRHRSMKNLRKFRDEALTYCKENKIEGMVIKAYKISEQIRNKRKSYRHGLLQAKVKLDIPKPKRRKISKGTPIYPPIPESDILGAIDKAWQELGNEDFRDVRKAMPLVAKFVSEECRKHLYSNPEKKLFAHYKQYLEKLQK